MRERQRLEPAPAGSSRGALTLKCWSDVCYVTAKVKQRISSRHQVGRDEPLPKVENAPRERLPPAESSMTLGSPSGDSARLAVGIDVGGTLLKAGLVDPLGRLQEVERRPTRAQTASVLIGDIIDVGDRMLRRAHELGRGVSGVGVAMPHYSVGPTWVQTYCTNLPALEGVDLYPALQRAFGNAIHAEFDTNAATLAELRFGAARGFDRVVCMVIGTGVSCGIVVDGGTLLGYRFGTAGETGHVIVDPTSSARCPTAGCRGCLESIVAAPAIARAAYAAIEAGRSPALARSWAETGSIDAAAVSGAALAGDAAAGLILERAGTALGVGLVSLLHIYAPDAIIIGGGVAAADELLLDPARRVIHDLGAPFFTQRLQVLRRAALGADAGIIGAAIPLIEANEPT